MAERAALPVARIREDFPILARRINGRPIVYLDSAATSLKPRAVIDAVVDFYENRTANVHRGVHRLSTEASELFDEARGSVADLLSASPRDIVFVRNATEAVNLVARSLPSESVVACSAVEHHSNLLPWRQRARAPHLIDVHPDGRLDLEALDRALRAVEPDWVAIAHVSNAFGVIQPIEAVIERCHAHGARVLVDASQSVPHRPVDVTALDCDLLCFSGHKMCGPGGIGVLYGKPDCLEALAPQIYGGDMVSEVHEDGFELRDVPWRFEAGTPSIEAVIGLGAAARYLMDLSLEAVAAHEHRLVERALGALSRVSGLELYGPKDAGHRASSVAFTIEGIDAHGVARMLSNRHNILVRSGHHCAQPAHERLGVPPSVRASFYLYNTLEEVDALAEAVAELTRFGRET